MINDISKLYIRNAQTNNIVLLRENVLSISDLSFDLSNVPNGNYIVAIENTEGQLFSKPVQIFK